MPADRHPLVVAALVAAAAVAVLLAVTWTPWTLLALPFCLVGGVGAWLGLDLERFSQAVGSAEDDAGRGVPGLLP